MTNVSIAALAAIISTVSLTVSWMTYRRDRPKAKVIVFKTALISGSRNTEPHTSINITNTGRRQLTITIVGYKTFWRPFRPAIWPSAPNIPKKLTEGDSVVCLLKKSEALNNGSWKGVAYVFACDSTGKEYRCSLGPAYKVWVFKLYAWLLGPLLRIKNSFKHKDD